MRIAIDYTPALNQRAGIGRYTRSLVGALACLDRTNHYLLLWARGRGAKPADGWPPNFRLQRLPLSEWTLKALWHRLGLPLPLEFLVGNMDLFHATDFVLPPLQKGKALLTVHDLSFLLYPEQTQPELVRYLSKVVPSSIQRASLVLADSESTKADLMRLLALPEEKVEVVYCGVDTRFSPASDEETLSQVRVRYGLDRPFILTLGTLAPRKNLARLLEAFALMRQSVALPHRLLVAGVAGWRSESLPLQVERLGLVGEVIFLGFVPEEDLPALYTLADLFVYPSLYEGFGLPPLEAMACGTPVAASNASSLPEVLGDAGLLFDATSPEAMAEALHRALTDGELRLQMRERGLRRAASFTWERAAQKLLGLYQQVGGG